MGQVIAAVPVDLETLLIFTSQIDVFPTYFLISISCSVH